MKLPILLFFAAFAAAQTPHLEFEVASIKPSLADEHSSGWSSANGSLRMQNQSLRAMLVIAYQVSDAQIIGGPKWMGSDRFEINAKPPQSANTPELLQMLQSLLADRFKLVLRRERREVTGYALVAAKGGLKIHPVEDPGGSQTNGSRGRLDAKATGMDKLAEILQRNVEAPVSDETGAKGVFDFTLEWAKDQAAEATQPSLYTALQEQLGLRLEARKVRADVLIIESAEKPGEN